MYFLVSPALFELLQKDGYIEEREGRWKFTHSETEVVAITPFLYSVEAIDIPDNGAKMSALRANLRKG